MCRQSDVLKADLALGPGPDLDQTRIGGCSLGFASVTTNKKRRSFCHKYSYFFENAPLVGDVDFLFLAGNQLYQLECHRSGCVGG